MLIELAQRTPALRDPAARDAFFDVVRTLGSGGEDRRVMEAVLR